MPTSIAHLGGRARVAEPGRYRKENNKNLKSQGFSFGFGKGYVIRRMIARRVNVKEAIHLLW